MKKRLKILLSIILIAAPVLAGGVEVQVFFSPEGGARDAIISHIAQANKYIDVAVYCFTSRHLARALVNAHKRGVKIRVIMDRECAENRYSKEKYLKKRGIPVKRLPQSNFKSRFFRKFPPKMHHKFAIIDGEVVITGSYNWTASAEVANYETLLVFTKAHKLAALFQEEFEKMWKGLK